MEEIFLVDEFYCNRGQIFAVAKLLDITGTAVLCSRIAFDKEKVCIASLLEDISGIAAVTNSSLIQFLQTYGLQNGLPAREVNTT